VSPRRASIWDQFLHPPPSIRRGPRFESQVGQAVAPRLRFLRPPHRCALDDLQSGEGRDPDAGSACLPSNRHRDVPGPSPWRGACTGLTWRWAALIIVPPSRRGWARRGGQAKRSPTAPAPGSPRPRRPAEEEECLAQRRKDAEKRSRAACGCTSSPCLLFASLRLCASFSFFPRRRRGGRNDDQDHPVSGETGRAPASQRRSGVAARDGFGGIRQDADMDASGPER
jgi:hypothetical protein